MQPIAENIFNLHLRRFELKEVLKTVSLLNKLGAGKAMWNS